MEESLMSAPELQRERKNDFSKGRVSETIMRLAIPMTLAQLVNIMYSVVDRVYLGHLPGMEHLPLTGVGITQPIIVIIMSIAALCGTGGSPLFSIARGRGDDDEAERILGNSFAMLLLLGAFVTLLVIIFKQPILYRFGASHDTYPYANSYLSVYSAGTLFVMVSLGMNPFINAQGFPKTGMLTVTLGAVVNIILDPLFIFALGLGVAGAALATILAQACSALWVLRFLTGKRTILRLKLRNLRLEAARVRSILALGLSGFCMNLTTSLTQIVCNVTLQKHGGDLYVGVMTVINSLREIIFMPVQGINNSAVPVISFNFGAKKTEKVLESIRFSALVTVAYALFMWAAVMLLPGTLIRIFSNEPDIIAVGVPAVRIYFALFVFMSLQMSGQVAFLGLGRSKNAIFFSLLRKALIAAPLTVLFPIIGLGSNGVFIAEAVSQFVGGVACFGTMYLAVYRKLQRDSSILN